MPANRSGPSKFLRYRMRPPARVSSKRRRSASVTSGPRTPNTSCRPTISSSCGISGVEQVRLAGPGELEQGGSPRSLDPVKRDAALDGSADAVAAGEEIDGELLLLELVGGRPPLEVAWRLAAGLGDEGHRGGERAEALPVGHVELHPFAPRAL